MNKKYINFDSSLDTLVKCVFEKFPQNLRPFYFLRDSAGRLSVIVETSLDEKSLSDLNSIIHSSIFQYARTPAVICANTELGNEHVIKEALKTPTISINGKDIHLIDRRAIGSDWLIAPTANPTKIPRLVFASIKGGVGRSTALCVAASYLSQKGKRVLAIDLDLEAPGIGTMLFQENETPKYGSLDYFVESKFCDPDDYFIADLVGDTKLGANGGRVSAIAAIGTSTISNPRDALSKISRAYLEKITDQDTISFTGQLQLFLNKLEATGKYDVILIDSRAGLHETTAASIIGSGGEVLLFGIDQPQTFLGYKLLFSHMERFRKISDWHKKITFVNAKASSQREQQTNSEGRFQELLSPPSRELNSSAVLTSEDFLLEWTDEEIEIEMLEQPDVIHILNDSQYQNFDPLADGSLLESKISNLTYGQLFKFIDSIVDADLL